MFLSYPKRECLKSIPFKFLLYIHTQLIVSGLMSQTALKKCFAESRKRDMFLSMLLEFKIKYLLK